MPAAPAAHNVGPQDNSQGLPSCCLHSDMLGMDAYKLTVRNNSMIQIWREEQGQAYFVSSFCLVGQQMTAIPYSGQTNVLSGTIPMGTAPTTTNLQQDNRHATRNSPSGRVTRSSKRNAQNFQDISPQALNRYLAGELRVPYLSTFKNTILAINIKI